MDICPECGADISFALYDCPLCGATIEEDYLLDEREQVYENLRNAQNDQNEDMINQYQQELDIIEGSEEYKHAYAKSIRCMAIDSWTGWTVIDSSGSFRSRTPSFILTYILTFKYPLLFLIMVVGIISAMVKCIEHIEVQPTNNSTVAASDTTLYSDTIGLIVSDASNDAPKHYVGIWRISKAELPYNTYTEIYEQGGAYYQENYKEGQKDRTSKSMLKKNGNKYYDPMEIFGQYYVVKNGQLRYYNENGDFTDKAGYKIKRIK